MTSKVLVLALVASLLAVSVTAHRDLRQASQGPQDQVPAQAEQGNQGDKGGDGDQGGQQGAQQQPPFPPAPAQCQNEWSPETIECTFPCPATGNWTLTCTASSIQGAPTPGAGVAECGLKREEGQNQQGLNFICLVTAPFTPPNCMQGLQALNAVPDPCVTQTAGSIVQGWPANATQS